MKKNGLIILAFITIVGGYFVFFFETEAQKSERLAKAEQDRIEALGAWQVSQRSTSSNRELARKMGVSLETFSEAFGDISSSVRDLHYEASLFLATAYQNEDGSYSMTVSFGEVDKLTSAGLEPPRDSALSSYSLPFLMKSDDDEASQSEKERAERTFHLISRLSSPFSTDCYGKVCRFDLSPAHLKLLSRHAEFVVELSGWTLGSRSGNRIPIFQKYQVPTQGLFENLQLDFEVGSENVDSVATAKKYVCQEAKDLCSDL